MAELVRASHPVYGTRVIPSAWLTTYPGAWTPLDEDDPETSPDPLPLYMRDADLDAAVADLVQTGGSATAVAQRAAFVAGRVLNSNGTVSTQKKLTVKLTADGLDIDDLIIEDVA